MSFTEPAADPVQPEGQGGEGTGGNPAYAEYLDRIPDDARPVAEEAFKAWDANYQRTTQEAAEARKTWEPYQQIGITQHQPDQVQWALQVAQAAQENPQALREWLDQQHGPVAAPEPQAPEDPFAYQDPSQQLEKLLGEKLTPLQQQLEQFSEWRQQLEQQAHEAQISEQINAEVSALKGSEAAQALPEKIRENFEREFERFANPYAVPGANPKDVVAKGWADLQSFVNELEKAYLQSKADAPNPAESGGRPSVAPPEYKRVKDAESTALEALRNMNRA